MLLLFRRNHFINYIWLFIFIVLGLGYYFLSPEKVLVLPFELPFSDVFKISFPGAQLPLVQVLYGGVLILVQSILVAHLVIKNRMSRQLSLVPAGVMGIYCLWVMTHGVTHTILLANILFLFSIQSLFRIYKKYKPSILLFNSGFFLGCASLIYFPYFIYFIVGILGLMSLRGIKVQELLQYLIGFLTPIFLVGVALFYNRQLPLLWQHLDIELYWPDWHFSVKYDLIKLVSVFIICLLIFFMQNSLLKKKKFDVIKKIELSYWYLLFGLFSVFFTEQPLAAHMIIISIPVSVLSGLYLEERQYTVAKEFVYLFWMVLYLSMILDIL